MKALGCQPVEKYIPFKISGFRCQPAPVRRGRVLRFDNAEAQRAWIAAVNDAARAAAKRGGGSGANWRRAAAAAELAAEALAAPHGGVAKPVTPAGEGDADVAQLVREHPMVGRCKPDPGLKASSFKP